MTFTGEPCTKTTRFHRHEDGVFESDLPLETRCLTDLYLDEDEPSVGHRKVFFDIEVSMEDDLPDVETANNPVTSIALYDDVTEGYFVYVLNTNGDKEDYENERVQVRFFQDEFDLLSAFLDLWEAVNPTIISGWNSDHFDVPYLYRRMQHVLGPPEATRISSIRKIKYSNYRQKYQIAGISSLDYLDLYRKFTYTELPNYRLDTVARHELGDDWGKIEYDGSLDDLFENDLEKFIEYNLRDVEILVEMDKKIKLIELVRGICHIGHVPYEDYGFSSRYLEGTIVTYLHRKGLVVTDKDPRGREMMDNKTDDDKFAGAYVKTPLSSKYDWVYSLDLQSLYPSIIMSLNISPETKAAKVLNWDLGKYKDGTMNKFNIQIGDSTQVVSRGEFDEWVKQQDLALSSNGILYHKDRQGIVPEILDKWFDERVEYKDLMKKYAKEGEDELAEFYDRRQHIQKIFLNSLYGVLGLPVFRFFDVDNAVAVTATGQEVIRESAQFVNNIYKQLGAEPRNDAEIHKYNLILKEEASKRKELYVPADREDWCIYIDTDSVYFSIMPLLHKMGDVDRQEATIKLAKMVEGRLNTFYDELARESFNVEKHRLFIKGETIAKSAIWIVKKRYAMLKTYDLEKDMEVEPKLVVKGLDIVRSSFPTVFKEYMRQFILDLLNSVEKKEVDDKLVEFVNSLTNRHYSDVARNTAVKKLSKYELDDTLGHHKKGTPMHVKAAINYNDFRRILGIHRSSMPISDGEKIKYVILKDNKYNLDIMAFKDYEDPPEIVEFLTKYCDHHMMFEKELKKKLDDFYQAMGWGLLPTDKKVNDETLNLFGL